jgi:predicted phage tail component-like protein
MIYGYGFTFNAEHSGKFKIVAQSDNRSLLPEKRRNEFRIPGRDGAVDFGGNNYEKRLITVKLSLLSKNLEELRENARAAAKWLSGEGFLIFDDEPDKAYKAKVYQPLNLSQLGSVGESTVTFDCQPFAESRHLSQFTDSITSFQHTTLFEVGGTQDTPCIIIIRNTGTTDLQDIRLVRKAEE